MYARAFFKEDAKAAADEMVRYIRAEFDEILRSIDWMDEATRERAMAKAKAITPHIAYPPELLEDDKLTDLYDGVRHRGSLLAGAGSGFWLCIVERVLNYILYIW